MFRFFVVFFFVVDFVCIIWQFLGRFSSFYCIYRSEFEDLDPGELSAENPKIFYLIGSEYGIYMHFWDSNFSFFFSFPNSVIPKFSFEELESNRLNARNLMVFEFEAAKLKDNWLSLSCLLNYRVGWPKVCEQFHVIDISKCAILVRSKLWNLQRWN